MMPWRSRHWGIGENAVDGIGLGIFAWVVPLMAATPLRWLVRDR